MKSRFLAKVAAIALLTMQASPASADTAGSASGGTVATQSALMGCVYRSPQPTPSNGQQIGANCDSNGNLMVTVSGGILSGLVGVKGTDGTNIASPSNPLDTHDTALTTAVNNSVISDGTSNSGIKGNPVSVNSNTACNTGVSGSAASNGTINKAQGDLLGNTCVRSVPNVNGLVSGVGSQTTLNTDTTIISATASKVTYVTSIHCSNSGSTAFLATIKNNTAGSTLDQFWVPAGSGYVVGGGSGVLYATLSGDPLVFSMSASSTTGYCAASGFAQ